MRRLCLIVVSLLAAPEANAELALDGWPQARRDAALTAQSPEPAIANPMLAWGLPVGDALGGEPIAHACGVFVGNGGGGVVRVNARSGSPEWATPPPLNPCRPPAPAPSSLALSTEDALHAGLLGDEGVLEMTNMACSILAGCLAYRTDNAEVPPGLDLPAELSPTYMTWPMNTCTGAPVADTDVPSPGDIRFERISLGAFYLGVWGVDGGMVDAEPACGADVDVWQGLAPTWPRTMRRSGGIVSRAADGEVAWGTPTDAVTRRTAVALLADGAVWTQDGASGWQGLASEWGRMLVTTIDGNERWQARRLAHYVGSPARDAGNLFSSLGAELYANRLNAATATFESAIEDYANDVGALPPTGELNDILVPAYRGSLPNNPLTGAAARWSLTPSPGDYSYETFNGGSEYRLGWWTSSGVLVAVWETFVPVQPATDEPPSVERRSADDGALAWRVPLPGWSDPTPVMLAAGVVLVAQEGRLLALAPSDGAELWRVDLGATLDRPLALLPDGGIVGASSDGWLLAVDGGPSGRVRWRYPLGAPLGPVAPTVTSDGITYLGDLAGRLHSVRADGTVLWTRDLGGPLAAGLTTSAIAHEGWLYVGRSDGVLIGLAPDPPGWRPPQLAGVLRAWRTSDPAEARLEWADSPLPAVLGAHYHLRRSAPSSQGPWSQVLAPHAFTATSWTDSSPREGLVFYLLTDADCGENEPPGG